MHPTKRTLAVLMGVSMLSACASNQPQTIGSLAYKPPAQEQAAPAPMSHEQVRGEYNELVDLFEDQHLKEQIERRVADVYMMEGVQDQHQAGAPTSHYVEAIKAYRNILEKYPDSPDNAEVLYQLAKAYDLEGNQSEAMKMLAELTQRHPHYVNVAEAHFRMGDIHFNNEDYAAAQAAYTAVTGYENERLATNARYMLGWSYYKQSQFQSSLQEFAVVLDELLTGFSAMDELSDAARPMAEDALHSMSLAFDKVGGGEAIATLTPVADKPYVWMLYDDLGDYYLEKELYEASASTYRLFVDKHGQSDKAPVLHSKIIATYINGGFPSLALEEKEAYVAGYGLHSSYNRSRPTMQPQVERSIKTYLDELARHYYNEGQALNAQKDENKPELAAALQDAEPGNDQARTAQQSDQGAIDPEALVAYEKAADFYFQYTETFPQDERIDEVYFLMSEALFLAQRYDRAIPGYERVAYTPAADSAEAHAANAGYAAIIAYQEHIASLGAGEEAVKEWQARAVESMLRFAKRFHADTRAVSVLTNAAEYLFSLNEFEQALQVASDLIEHNDALDPSLKKTAYGIIAHSHFNLDDYHNAELNYIEQRALIAPDSDEYRIVSERLATAMYRKSEIIEARGETDEAVAQLLKIKQLTPDSQLRVPAQYEAATLLLGAERWEAAITELSELSSDYPEHELALEFPRRLAFAYEQNESWAQAAAHYQALAQDDPDQDTRREALFVAATMFEKDQNYTAAIDHFRDYANQYEQPTDMLMEARYNLALNYERVGDTDRKLFWLDKIVEGGNQFERTDRNRWLSAWADSRYGDFYAEQFRAYALSLPLVESLPRKNDRLEQASYRYQRAAEQGVFEFATMSSFKIAQLYHQLAGGLRSSPVPASLSEQERGMYADLIEEQAVPFDELAMELYQANIDRAWSGRFNQWIDQSFAAMRKLNPARFDKSEIIVSYGDDIR